MIQRLKCRLGLHSTTKWLPGNVLSYYRIEARSCIRCGKVEARFPHERPEPQEATA